MIPGFLENDSYDLSPETARQILEKFDFNVIFVDWFDGNTTYSLARNQIRYVGAYIAEYLDWMHDNDALIWSEVTVIGFSLGAHCAGFIGKKAVNKINTIIGLDPSGALFSAGDPTTRLAPFDAQYVEAIHTNGNLAGFGINSKICK